MNATQRQACIDSGFNWLDCLLGDIWTFLGGIACLYRDGATAPDGQALGGGNVSVPILACTALELMAALYAGVWQYRRRPGGFTKRKRRRDREYRVDLNVRRFVRRFFPRNTRAMALLLWDGVRNGHVHSFMPKRYTYKGQTIRFEFVSAACAAPMLVEPETGGAVVGINVFELACVLRQVRDDFRRAVQSTDTLQRRFITVWRLIQDLSVDLAMDRDKAKEAAFLLRRLHREGALPLFGS